MNLRTISFKQVESSKSATPCVVRRTWTNQNSAKDQVNVQFFQVVDRPVSGTFNALGLLSQGITINPTRKLTAIKTFKRQAAIDMGLKIDHDYMDGQAPLAESLFGIKDVNIELTESCTKNPMSPNQAPSANPTSGEVRRVKDSQDQAHDVYNHTELIIGTANHQFITKFEDIKRVLSTGQLEVAKGTSTVEKSQKAFA